ncbi:MAG: hypothetical protein HOJ34_02875 [Kordiimonadaceae bacterium]|nr:hypothetical protein [Kordiimonadaceae bacterium]
MTDLFDTAASSADYSAKDIEVLEGLEPVRLRPGMYVGGTDERALHHLVSLPTAITQATDQQDAHKPQQRRFPTAV